LYIRGTFFANKVFGFDDDAILFLDIDFFTLKDVFHDIDLRSSLFKEGEDDMNQVRFEIWL
jgi:hypothetical protein